MVELEQYREVRRRAKVGEKVRVVNNTSNHYLSVGDVVTITRESSDDVATDQKGSWMRDDDYVVLEPIADSTPSIESRVLELERRLALVEAKMAPVHVSVSTPNVTTRGLSDMANILSGKTDAGTIKPGTGFVPLSRDDVITMAKRDVEVLVSHRHVRVPVRGNKDNTARYEPAASDLDGYYDDVEFVVNRDKRTVVALVRGHADNNSVIWARGKARACADECFNVHIGRAIAVRRAFGLDVPDYYTNVPQPDRAQVGDVVGSLYNPICTYTVIADDMIEASGQSKFQYEFSGLQPYMFLIDDSHDFGGIVR